MISVALFGSVFVFAGIFLGFIIDPPYGWIVAAAVIVGITVILTTGVRNELSKAKKQERM